MRCRHRTVSAASTGVKAGNHGKHSLFGAFNRAFPLPEIYWVVKLATSSGAAVFDCVQDASDFLCAGPRVEQGQRRYVPQTEIPCS